MGGASLPCARGVVHGDGPQVMLLDMLLPLVTMSPRRFAMKLKNLRASRGLTQGALAKKAGISRAYLARLEMGLHDPHLSRLRTLAKALGVKVSALVD